MNDKKGLNNDTPALIGLIIIAILGLLRGADSDVTFAIGAIGGYIGSKNIANR